MFCVEHTDADPLKRWEWLIKHADAIAAQSPFDALGRRNQDTGDGTPG